jgi:hypothetical protein
VKKGGFVASTQEIELAAGKSPPIKVKLVPADAEARARPEPPKSEIDEARAQLERSGTEARKKLLAGFDATLKRLGKSKEAAEENAARIDVVKAEKARFEKRNLLPWSEPMRPYMLAYLHSLRAVRETVGHVFSDEIDKQAGQKNQEQADQLRAEWQRLQGGEVVARWVHHVNMDSGGVISLYANGKIGDPGSDNTWTFEGGVLTLRWPNSDAPGGVWVDTCPVSSDGKTYSGENQQKVSISGDYSEDD